MGFAIAAEAARRGAEVTLIAGPTTIEVPPVREVVRVRKASEMHEAVISRAVGADVVVMAAAVADYAPVESLSDKLSKDDESLTVTLRRTPDILAELGRRRAAEGKGPLLVGFAAETREVIARAEAKRNNKHVDLVVANDVSRRDAGFEVDMNAVTFVSAEGADTLPLQSKARVAAALLDRIENLLADDGSRATRRASALRG
jgi:phosphopantothenoylcysteine decarboxylase/phosphopantothenate--cysteine ligase